MWGLSYYAVFVLGATFTGGGVAGYTLRITSANATYSGTSDDGIIFSFCEGGSYCTPGDDDEVLLPSDLGIDEDGGEVVVTVSLGYEPTTLIITKSSNNSDAWYIVDVVWEDGDDLLGRDGSISLESETGSVGCIDGLSDGSEDTACLGQWRFFNLNGDTQEDAELTHRVSYGDCYFGGPWDVATFGAIITSDDCTTQSVRNDLKPSANPCMSIGSMTGGCSKGLGNYMYDVRVLPCSGTGGSTVKAHFCSHASCDGTAGEEVDVLLTTSSEDESGWTLSQFSSDFNPVAMRLSEVDSNWCAEDMTFNLFDMGNKLNTAAFDDTVNGTACK